MVVLKRDKKTSAEVGKENLQISKEQVQDFFNKAKERTDKVKATPVTNQTKKVTEQMKSSQKNDVLEQLRITNNLISKLLDRTIQYDLYPLSSNFSTLTTVVTATAQLAYRAATARRMILSMSGAGSLFIGNQAVNTTTGYPIIIGDALELLLKRDTELWVIGTAPATLHILLF